MSTPASDAAPHAADVASVHARLDAIEQRLDRLFSLIEVLGEAPKAASALVDVVDERVSRMEERGVDVQERLDALVPLLEKATEPAVLNLLGQVIELAPTLPGLISMLVDMGDEFAGKVQDDGIDPVASLSNGLRVAMHFGAIVNTREIQALTHLLGSPILDHRAIGVISTLTQALVECQDAPRKVLGPVGLLLALRDPDIGRGLDFVMGLLRRFGAALAVGAPSPHIISLQAREQRA